MPSAYEPRDVRVCDETGAFLFWCSEQTARAILKHQAAALIRNADGPNLWARRKKWREMYAGPDHGMGWLHGARHWPSPFDIIAGQQRRALLDSCLETLTRTQRSLITLRYRQGLKFKEVAAVLETSEEAVLQMHQRTIGSLRDRLAEKRVAKLSHIL